jgi:hypothetical protein
LNGKGVWEEDNEKNEKKRKELPATPRGLKHRGRMRKVDENTHRSPTRADELKQKTDEGSRAQRRLHVQTASNDGMSWRWLSDWHSRRQ